VEPIHILRALRRWWAVIVATTIIGIAAGYAFSGGGATTYEAKHTLILNPVSDASTGATDEGAVQRLAFFATNGDVPTRVAQKLGGNPEELATHVSASADPTVRTVTITGTAESAARAEELSNTFATELIASTDAQAKKLQDQQFAAATAKVQALQLQLADLNRQVAAASPANAAAETAARDDVTTQLNAARTQMADLSGPAPTSGLESVAPAHASVLSAPESARSRVLIGGIAGFLVGIGLALVFARFDTRIRTKEDAEHAFGVQVIAEIPVLPRRARDSQRGIVAATQPESAGAEAFRRLRTLLLLGPPSSNGHGNGQRPKAAVSPKLGASHRTGRVIGVLSGAPSEGKTTTTANVAVALAGSGRSVLALDLDLRRPTLNVHFGVNRTPGLTDVLSRAAGAPPLEDVVEGPVSGVQIAPSGAPSENPGELLAHGAGLFTAARKLADVVLVDTAPMLVADETSLVVPFCDEVVIVCRVGKTTIESAGRLTQLLDRVGVQTTGVVLVGAQLSPTMRTYYRTEYPTRRTRAPESVGNAAEGSGTEAPAPAPEKAVASRRAWSRKQPGSSAS
jgi:capsular exopolysaccharide synthesis family protein